MGDDPIIDVREATRRLVERAASGVERYPTGYSAFDERFGAIGAGELGLLSARSTVGKSTWILNVISRTPQIRTVVFSKEMEAELQSQFLACMCSELACSAKDIPAVLAAGDDDPRFGELVDAIQNVQYLLPSLHFSWPQRMTIDSMRSYCDAVYDATDTFPQRVFVDHLTLMEGQRTTEGLNANAAALKQWAKNDKLAVIVVQQNNRTGPEGAGPNNGHIAPSLSSGMLGGEEHADWIWGLYQPALNPKFSDKDKQATPEYNSLRNMTRFSVVKNRVFAARDLVGVDLMFDIHSHRLTPRNEPFHILKEEPF